MDRFDLDLFEELVLVLGERRERGIHLVACTAEFAQFSLPEGAVLVVLRHRRGNEDQLRRMVLRVCEGLERGTLYLVAAGGDHSCQEILETGRPPARRGKRVRVFAIDDSRTPWSGSKSTAPKDLSIAFEALRKPLDASPSYFLEWLQERQGEARQQRERIDQYQRVMLARKPVATTALVVSLLVVYGLEFLFGGTSSVPVLFRMGALIKGQPLGEEPWRLLAHSFLHGGMFHVGGNALILWLAGSFLERLIGSSRLLLLWTLSLLGGGLAIQLFPGNAAVTIGASGGGWGLMTAAGVLALRPRGLIPDLLARGIRRNIGQLLVLNLVVSFLPNVALAGHMGGGLVGAILVASGLVTFGLHPSATNQPDRGVDGPTVLARTTAVICVGALAASLALGITRGEPWVLNGPQTWSRHSLELPEASRGRCLGRVLEGIELRIGKDGLHQIII